MNSSTNLEVRANQKPCRISNRLKNGFTFLEILIVTTIVAVIAALAIPRFRITYENLRIHSLANHITQLTEAAHELSIIERRVYKILIKKDPPSISILKETSAQKRFENLSGGIGKPKVIPEGYEIKSEENEIVFYPNGDSTRTQIVMQNDMGNKVKIDITGTGSVSQLW